MKTLRRRFLAWTFLGAAALVVSAVLFSLFATVIWAPEARPSGLQSVVMARGSVAVTWGPYLDFGGGADLPDWKVLRGTPSTYRWQWSPAYRHAEISRSNQFILPLWIPAAVLGSLGAWMCCRGCAAGARDV
ncbi:MAG: hypothetical protein IT437_13015 [Phycisphaerales bacterium]|nr:hypothetical protein [Phycisphaerales bacterium]